MKYLTNLDNILVEIKDSFLDGEKITNLNSITSNGKREINSRIYIKIHTNKRNLFIKYAQNEKLNIFRKEYDALKKVDSDYFSIPQPLGLISKGIIMSEIKGIPLENRIKTHGLTDSIGLLEDVIIHIARFHKSNVSKSKIETSVLYKEVTGNEDFAQIQTLRSKITVGFTHGDLDPFNTFFDKNTSKFGLIDWEDFREYGIQGLDILHFIIMLAVIANPKLSYRKLYEAIFRKDKGNVYIRLLDLYCIEMVIHQSVILELLPVYCDAQNHRLKKNLRNTNGFLYHEFKRIYYE